jgi:cytochrome c oxidase subunit 1
MGGSDARGATAVDGAEGFWSAAGAPARRLVALWSATMLALFVVLVLLGLTMRLGQAELLALHPGLFYAIMTMHGLGMAGVLYSAGFGALWLLCRREVELSHGVLWTSYALIVAGALGLVAATLIGRFGPGWYVLYPLPFVRATWPGWATGLAVISLMALGVGWLIGQLDLLRGLARRYGLGRMLGWHWFGGGQAGGEEVPILVLIATVVAVAGALATVCGAAMLMMYLLQWLSPEQTFDPLLLKNMVFLFGHTVVNITMYCGVGFVYAMLPRFTGRPWRGNATVALAWNATLVFVLLAYFHHLYMDFAQPIGLQYAGQIASYLSAVPATVVTVFGVAGQIWRAPTRWSFAPLALVAGVVGWVVGGFAAVLDATIVINRTLHNTLWVPGHFHTYFLVGFVLLLFAFAFDFFRSSAERLACGALWTLLASGYGFVAMFYLAGAGGVPRRYAGYAALKAGTLHQTGAALAGYGAGFATLFLLGVLALLAALWLGRPRARA